MRVPLTRAAGLAFLLTALLAWPPRARAAPVNVTLTIEGERVSGLYWLPARSGGEKAPGMVLLHMLGRAKEDWRSFGDFLQTNGYAAIALDLRGQGGDGKAKLMGDARAGFAFLARQMEVDAARIGVIGASIGANTALLFAVEEPKVKCVALLSPGLNYHGVTTDWAITRMKRPLLLVASDDDDYSAQTVRRLEQLASGPKVVKIYSHAGHGTEIFAAHAGLEAEILAFLKTHL